MDANDVVTERIIGAAIRLHRRFGPGLLESVYTPTLGQELLDEGLEVEIAKPLSLEHKGLVIHRAYVLDLLVGDRVIVEVKCVSKISDLHVAQLLTYLRLTGLQVGLILNFNVRVLKDGIRRVINSHREETNRKG